MQATISQRTTIHRQTPLAILGILLFAAGIALGSVATGHVAPTGAKLVAGPVLDPDAPGFRQLRDGEIGSNAFAANPDAAAREQRRGEFGSRAAGQGRQDVLTSQRGTIGGP